MRPLWNLGLIIVKCIEFFLEWFHIYIEISQNPRKRLHEVQSKISRHYVFVWHILSSHFGCLVQNLQYVKLKVLAISFLFQITSCVLFLCITIISFCCTLELFPAECLLYSLKYHEHLLGIMSTHCNLTSGPASLWC